MSHIKTVLFPIVAIWFATVFSSHPIHSEKYMAARQDEPSVDIPEASDQRQERGTPSGRERVSRGDDPTLAELQAVLQQQAAALQAVQSGLQAEKNRADDLGAVVQDMKSDNEDLKNEVASLRARLEASSRAVGFSARYKTDGGQFTGISLGQHSTLVFDNVQTNSGNAYDPNTGIFTAPVAGLYSFFLTQMTADSEPHLWLSMQVDGHTLDRIYTEGGPTDTHDQGASQVTTQLQTGQRVWVRQEEGGAVRGAWFTVFTGYLIQAD